MQHIKPIDRPSLEFHYDNYTMTLANTPLNIYVEFDNHFNADTIHEHRAMEYEAIDDNLHLIFVRVGYHMYSLYDVVVAASNCVQEYHELAEKENDEWYTHTQFYSNPSNR